jgi:hypothetical protein
MKTNRSRINTIIDAGAVIVAVSIIVVPNSVWNWVARILF